MKVILLDDVPRVGHEGDIIDVADGYLRNYLEPRGLAVRATRGAIKDLENRRKAIAQREEEKRVRAQQLAEELRTSKIIVHAPTGEGTRLHGTVTAQQIAEAAAEQLNFQIDRRDIDIPEPIREIGDYLVSARVYKDVTAQLPVHVVPLDVDESDEEQAADEEAAAEDEQSEAESAEEATAEETAGEEVAEEDREAADDEDSETGDE
ncbi:MAG: 50S ribosomal protein L9 [Armatimonadetes bacterium]|nr:50S ribosomal protein L9 [Armatimonadota bacterium]